MNNNNIIDSYMRTESCDDYLNCCMENAIKYARDASYSYGPDMTIYKKNIYNTNLQLFKHYDLLISDYIIDRYTNVTDISLYYYALLNVKHIKKILLADEYITICKQLQYWLILSYEYTNNKMSLYLLFEYYIKHNKYNNALIYYRKLKKTNIIILYKYAFMMNKLEKQNALYVIKQFLINLMYKPNIGIYYKRGLKQFNILCN